MQKVYRALLVGTAVIFAACSETTTAPQRGLSPRAGTATTVPDEGVIHQSNLTAVAACNEDEWHWVLNGLSDPSLAPDHITAYFASGAVNVPRTKTLNNVVHYTLPNDGSVVAIDEALIAPYASAELPAGTFYLRFNLSHGPCGGGGGVAESFVVTEIHLADHTVVSDQVPSLAGAVVHDKATVTINPTSAMIPLGSKVQFYFWNNANCSGTPIAGPDEQGIAVGNPSSVESGAQGPLAAGSYGFKALFVSGDATLVADGEGDCEPLTIAPAGKTMGFWGNTNGQARIGDYAVNSVDIGRGVTVSTKPQSLKTLPSSLNACGKSATVFVYNTVSNKDCTVAAGINVGTVNTAGAQTLAFGYNLKITWSGYSGITLGSAGCGGTAFGSLTGSSTLANVLTYAQTLLTGSLTGTSTQGQLGALNVVLNCMNKEV